MCCPFSVLKIFVRCSALATILLGFFALASGIGIKISIGEWSNFDLNQNRNKMVIFLLGNGFGLIFFGIVGSYGSGTYIKSRKNKMKLLFIFDVFLAILMIFSFLLSRYAYEEVIKMDPLNKSLCNDGSLFNQNQKLVLLAKKTLCQSDCQCFISDSSKWSVNLNSSTNASLPIQLDDCENYEIEPDSIIPYNFLQFLEIQLQCTGWCDSSDIFLFSNTSEFPKKNLIQDNNCFQQYKFWIVDHGNSLGAIAATVGALTLVNLIIAMCLCFHPEKNKKSNIQFFTIDDQKLS